MKDGCPLGGNGMWSGKIVDTSEVGGGVLWNISTLVQDSGYSVTSQKTATFKLLRTQIQHPHKNMLQVLPFDNEFWTSWKSITF
jgi:hypothetical protein